MCINTITNDCRDPDPMVRGIVIRSMSSLKLLPVLRSGFVDDAAYVRRNPVMVVLKELEMKPKYTTSDDHSEFDVVDSAVAN